MTTGVVAMNPQPKGEQVGVAAISGVGASEGAAHRTRAVGGTGEKTVRRASDPVHSVQKEVLPLDGNRTQTTQLRVDDGLE